MYLLVGLGNPGVEYAKHRHNIGFMALDRIAHDYEFSDWRTKDKGLRSEGKIGSKKVILVKPQTFMNESGRAVQPLVSFYKIAPENIFVFHDELDIAPGVMKVKLGGGTAGHNGLKSISACIGTDDYHRVRMGIGHPGSKARVTGHVLGNFREEDYDWLDLLLKSSSDHIEDLMIKPTDFTAKVMQDLKSLKNNV